MDRDKVINDLQDAVNDDWMWQHADYYAKAMENALALLKEQETMMQCIKGKCRICPHCSNCDVDEDGLLKVQDAVKPKYIDGKRNHFIKCGNCNNDLMSGMRYCPKCGKAVKWE